MTIFSLNKRAGFDYEILETFEAGIELKGFEVKSIASGRVSTVGSYAIVRGNEVWVVNLDIPPYQPQNTPEGYDPKRTRKLLLHKKEIEHLIGRTKEKGLTIVPIKMYNKNSKIKIELGLGRSKKKYDKREVIKKRETEREIRRLS
ncbi:MAG: SsrA-binding protein SmpB [Patescibacteria group bacterium]